MVYFYIPLQTAYSILNIHNLGSRLGTIDTGISSPEKEVGEEESSLHNLFSDLYLLVDSLRLNLLHYPLFVCTTMFTSRNSF